MAKPQQADCHLLISRVNKPKHPWKERMIVGVIMIVLALVGFIFTDIHENGGWDYWRYIIFVYALLSIWLSWYIRRKLDVISPVRLWHELLHWLGLILSVYLVSLFVDAGIMGRFPASLIVLTLLSLTLFLAGVYIEITFIPMGLLLGAVTATVALFVEYLYAIVVPLMVVAVICIYWLSHHHHKKTNPTL